MRYIQVPSITFTNARGETIVLKDIRPIASYSRAFDFGNSAGDPLDLVAIKAYGDHSEAMWYKIADQNIKEIVEKKFRLDTIKTLSVPIT